MGCADVCVVAAASGDDAIASVAEVARALGGIDASGIAGAVDAGAVDAGAVGVVAVVAVGVGVVAATAVRLPRLAGLLGSTATFFACMKIPWFAGQVK